MCVWEELPPPFCSSPEDKHIPSLLYLHLGKRFFKGLISHFLLSQVVWIPPLITALLKLRHKLGAPYTQAWAARTQVATTATLCLGTQGDRRDTALRASYCNPEAFPPLR